MSKVPSYKFLCLSFSLLYSVSLSDDVLESESESNDSSGVEQAGKKF